MTYATDHEQALFSRVTASIPVSIDSCRQCVDIILRKITSLKTNTETKMDTYFVLKGLCLLHVISRVSGDIPKPDKDKDKLNNMPDSIDQHRPTEDLLRKCLESVLSVPLTSSTAMPRTTPGPSIIRPKRCIYTDGNGKPEVRPPEQHRRRRSSELEDEISEFHRCICDSHYRQHSVCHFNLLTTSYDQVVLYDSFDYLISRAQIAYRNKDFYCRLRDDLTIICHAQSNRLSNNATRFQQILLCLATSMENLSCETNQNTSDHLPHITTASTNLSSQKGSTTTVGMIILILGCVLCLLFGILGTVCCAICCKKRKKGRLTVTRDRDMYDEQEGDVHAIMLDRVDNPPRQQPFVPEIVHSRPEAINTNSVSISTALDSVLHIPGADDDRYEPISDQDDGHCEYQPLRATKPETKPESKESSDQTTNYSYIPMHTVKTPEMSTGRSNDSVKESYVSMLMEPQVRYRRNSK